MSNLILFLPLFLGCVGILQGAINSQVSNSVGVTQATLITNIGAISICFVFYFLVRAYPQVFPDYFQIRAPFSTYKWWFVFPPLFGFLIIAGMPLAIHHLGAVNVTVGLIAAQMITSVVWDLVVFGFSLSLMKILGIIFAFLSVAFVTLSKN